MEGNMNYGLVLEGGAMRGLFTAGVIDVLMENEIEFAGAVGVSAGAGFGCNYKSRQPGRAIRYSTRFCREWKYCSVRSLLLTGDMYGAKFIYHTVPEKLDIFDAKAFDENPMKFYSVATDITTGKPVYRLFSKVDYNELEWLRASASMPLAARVVNVDGRKLLDGGITDSIPLKFMEKQGYEKNVVVLTQPRGFVKRPSRSTKLVSRVYKKYPNFVRACAERYKMYNSELKYIKNAEKEGRAFVIAPPEKLPIGHVEHNPDVMREAYRIGRKAALDRLGELKEFMK